MSNAMANSIMAMAANVALSEIGAGPEITGFSDRDEARAAFAALVDNAANAPADPALLALDRELRIRSLLADRAANTAAANRELAEFGHWVLDHDAFDREYADAIARLLAPDGAGEVADGD